MESTRRAWQGPEVEAAPSVLDDRLQRKVTLLGSRLGLEGNSQHLMIT